VVTQDFDIKQYGFRLGGPIIKNKLFFFANAEIERRTDPATQFTALRDGQTVGGTISRVRASDLDQLRQTLISRFNYDPGAYEGFNFNTQSDKATLKLDYNMDVKNRLSV
ncbi:MAG TPA: TonB-dependent receptor, partial [Saprospiraceae bacterium]|nr:TonB-dependent receptor [Saprospiraceae bacterium]